MEQDARPEAYRTICHVHLGSAEDDAAELDRQLNAAHREGYVVLAVNTSGVVSDGAYPYTVVVLRHRLMTKAGYA